MTNKLTRKRPNRLLTARNNYYSLGSFMNKLAGNPLNGKLTAGAFKEMSTDAVAGLLAAGPVIGLIGGGLIGGGMSSGAGNILQGLSGVAAAIPGPWGAVASAGLGVLGGLTNRMFGSKMNTENIAQVEANINSLNSFLSNASDFDTLASNWANADVGMTFSDSFIGKDGWFSNKAKNKAAALRSQVEAGNAWVLNTLTNNAENISTTQMQNLLGNYAAFGGPLMFADGGSIHIKPKNRGKFTETKRRTGKTTEELTHSKNPLTRKRAIFALNAKKWHHAFGGNLFEDGGDTKKPFMKAVRPIIFPNTNIPYLDEGPKGPQDITEAPYNVFGDWLPNSPVNAVPRDENNFMVSKDAYKPMRYLHDYVNSNSFADKSSIGLFSNSDGTPYIDSLDAAEIADIDINGVIKDNLRRIAAQRFAANTPITLATGNTYSGGLYMPYGPSNNVGNYNSRAISYDYDFLPDTVIAHEYGHSVDPSYSPYSRLSPSKNLLTLHSKKKLDRLGKRDSKAHEELQAETYADLQRLRYLLNKAGIYDSIKGGAFTKEHLNKFKAYIQDNNIDDRFVRLFDDEDVIWGINNVAAFGGDLLTHGSNFDTGVTLVGNGGTHEQNPYEGVPMGVDQEGVPNLVEEGEVIFNNYVFSKRLKVPKDLKNKYKLKRNKSLTFADAALLMSKESEERPNDPISLNGLEALLGELAYSQEEIRASRSLNKRANGGKLNRYDWGSFLKKLSDYSGSKIKSNQAGRYAIDTETFGTPELIRQLEQSKDYIDFSNWILNNPTNPDVVNYLRALDAGVAEGATRLFDSDGNLTSDWQTLFKNRRGIGATTATGLGGIYHFTPDRSLWDILSTLELTAPPTVVAPQEAASPTKKSTKPLRKIYVEQTFGKKDWDPEGMDSTTFASSGINRAEYRSMKDDDGNEYLYLLGPLKEMPNFDNWMRYAPIVGSLTGLGISLFSKPDESSADAILEATKKAGAFKPIRFNPVGNYLTYKPFDVEFAANKANAEAAAARRAITNTSGGNRAQAIAGILAADNNALNLLGILRRGAAEDNLKQRLMVEDFNRATNMFNSEGFFKADAANQLALAQARDFSLRGTMAAEEIRLRARLAKDNAILTNLSGLFNSIGNIGREKVARQLFNFMVNNGFVPGYGSDKKSKGGKIKRRKKGLTY